MEMYITNNKHHLSYYYKKVYNNRVKQNYLLKNMEGGITLKEYYTNFVHLGGDVVVNKRDILGIFDIKISMKSKTTKNFLKTCNDEGFISKITEEETRSFVIVDIKGKNNERKKDSKCASLIVYYSPISSLTLQKRACSSY